MHATPSIKISKKYTRPSNPRAGVQQRILNFNYLLCNVRMASVKSYCSVVLPVHSNLSYISRKRHRLTVGHPNLRFHLKNCSTTKIRRKTSTREQLLSLAVNLEPAHSWIHLPRERLMAVIYIKLHPSRFLPVEIQITGTINISLAYIENVLQDIRAVPLMTLQVLSEHLNHIYLLHAESFYSSPSRL